MSQMMDGKHVASLLREKIKVETEQCFTRTGKRPFLAVVIVGDDPASLSYVRSKEKFAAEVGFNAKTFALPISTSEDALVAQIQKLNEDDQVSGILVQLPLPAHINAQTIINTIDVKKDVDGFHPEQVGGLSLGLETLHPCTPAGIMALLAHYDLSLAGKHAVIIGRSNIVGKPIAQLLLNHDATVTVTHSKTKHLAELARTADLLVVAIGKPLFLTADLVKPGAIVIDVGINRNAEGKLVGDVDFESVREKAAYLTPVPGGIGPMTIAMLLSNTLKAFKRSL